MREKITQTRLDLDLPYGFQPATREGILCDFIPFHRFARTFFQSFPVVFRRLRYARIKKKPERFPVQIEGVEVTRPSPARYRTPNSALEMSLLTSSPTKRKRAGTVSRSGLGFASLLDSDFSFLLSEFQLLPGGLAQTISPRCWSRGWNRRKMAVQNRFNLDQQRLPFWR